MCVGQKHTHRDTGGGIKADTRRDTDRERKIENLRERFREGGRQAGRQRQTFLLFIFNTGARTGIFILQFH